MTGTYTTGCYAIPIRFLYGTAAEINFWDVVYFRAYEAGGTFDTSTEELVEQTGLSRQMVGRLRREAVEQGELIEDISWISGRRFVLEVPGFDRLAKGVIWKPLGYVRNGWHRVVTPAIPKRVLNLYLQQPHQRIYHLDVAYIAARCKRRFPYGDYRPVAPLNSADVGKALRLLVRLGLLVPDGGGFRIDWTTFNQPALVAAAPFDAPDLREHPSFCEATASDPERAERAVELLEIGRYVIDDVARVVETHFTDIFRDLAYVREHDYPLLKAKVYRHRNRPPGPRRWRDTWKAFQYELRRRVAEIRASKVVLDLSETTSARGYLALELGHRPGRVLAARMVSRVEWPWYFEGKASVRLTLLSIDKVLFARSVDPGDAEVRHMFHPDEWPSLAGSLTLNAQCDRPLPGVQVEAWLEARLRR